jgi:endo-1,4-beta-xylanase
MLKLFFQKSLMIVLVCGLAACGGGDNTGGSSSSASTSSKPLSSIPMSASSAATSFASSSKTTSSLLGSSSSASSATSSKTLTSSLASSEGKSSLPKSSSIRSSSSRLSSFASSQSSSSVAGELVVNGGFEESVDGDTTPINWMINTNNLSTLKVVESIAGANAHSGTKALEAAITSLGVNAWSIEATYIGVNGTFIDVKSAQDYEYSFWVKGPAGKKINFTAGTPEFAERGRTNVDLTGNWQQVNMVVTTVAGDTKLRLPTHLSIVGNAGSTIYFDDLSLREKTNTSSPGSVESLFALSPNNMPIGIAVAAGSASNSIFNSVARQNVIKQHFSQLTAENIMKPESLHPSQYTYNYADADALVQFAKDNGMSLHAHTLIWHNQIPDWIKNFSGNKATWIAMMESHIANIAGHFETKGSIIKSWDVVNEAFDDGNSGAYRGQSNPNDSVWYKNIGPEFIERAFVAARKAEPDADLYYNDYNLEWSDSKLGAVVNMVKDFRARNIPINGVGFQMHVWSNNSVAKLKSQFEKVVAIDPSIKVKLSELDVRFNHVTPAISAPSDQLYQTHKQFVHDMVVAYLQAVPPAQRGGITVWGLTDAESWILGLYSRPDWPLFFFNDLKQKPALQGFADALNGK